jgi:hypothetical protein
MAPPAGVWPSILSDDFVAMAKLPTEPVACDNRGRPCRHSGPVALGLGFHTLRARRLDLDDKGRLDLVDALVVSNEKQRHAVAAEHRELRVVNSVVAPGREP